jgi:WD40 repeat protein
LTDKEIDSDYIEKNYKIKYPFFVLLIILMSNFFLVSKQKQKDKYKIDFEPGASYQSQSYKKETEVPLGRKDSPNGYIYAMKIGDYRLNCFKISRSEENKDEIVWSKIFDSKIVDFHFDPKSGDRIYVVTQKGMLIGDILKGNFSYTIKSKPFLRELKIHIYAKISPKGDYYIMKEDYYRLIGFKISNGEKKEDEILWSKKFDSKIENIRFGPQNGNRIYVVTKKGTLIADTSKGIFSYHIKIKGIEDITYSHEGKGYVLIRGKKDLIFGNQKTGSLSKLIKDAHKKKIKFFDFISKYLLLTIGEDNLIKIWNINTYEMVINTIIHSSNIEVASLTFDRKYLILGNYDSPINIGPKLNVRQTNLKERFKLIIIDTRDLSIIKEIKGIKSKILEISISADNKFAAVVKADKIVDIWDLENSYIIKTFSGGPYIDAEFGPLGMTFLLVTETGKILRYITRGIVVDSRPQFVGEKYKINTPTEPIINKFYSGITIAVLDFSGLLIDSQLAEAISYFFRSRISNYSYVSVMKLGMINKILKVKGLEKPEVISPEKAASIGKYLNVKKMIMGKLTRLGSTLIITTIVVDVKSARIDAGREVECKNFALEDLPEMVDILLDILIEK